MPDVATPEFVADHDRRRPVVHIMFLGGPWDRLIKKMREPLPENVAVPVDDDPPVPYTLSEVNDRRGLVMPRGGWGPPWKVYVRDGYRPTTVELATSKP